MHVRLDSKLKQQFIGKLASAMNQYLVARNIRESLKKILKVPGAVNNITANFENS
jgi:hypothetical protein